MSPEEETVINRNTMKLQDHLYKALKQRDQFKTERATLIDDLKVLREKNEALKASENSLWRSSREFEHEKDELKEEMKRLHEESNITVFCALMEENSELNKENEKLRKQYTTLTVHIRLKAKNNPGVSRYIALVNFIDRLERGEDG